MSKLDFAYIRACMRVCDLEEQLCDMADAMPEDERALAQRGPQGERLQPARGPQGEYLLQ